MSYSEWNEIMKGRKKAAVNLPHLMKLPIITGGGDLLATLIKDGQSILDIGANDRNVERFLAGKGLKVDYASVDIDRTLEHDWYDLGSVDRKFDFVAAFEVIEHMDVKTVVECIKSAFALLKSGGTFVVTTPNVCHHVVFWRDCTHITPFRYDELYGLLCSTGFSRIEVFRCGRPSLKDKILGLYYRPFLRLMRMDFAPGIAVVARKG